MNEKLITEELFKWIIEFVEIPNIKLNNWPPCPYAKQARLNDKILVKFSTPENFSKIVQESIESLKDKEAVIICFDHTKVDPNTLQQFVKETNDFLMPLNYVILEDHPDIHESINGVNMNFGVCGLMILQKLDQLNIASEKLREKEYYVVWSVDDLQNVVSWRYK